MDFSTTPTILKLLFFGAGLFFLWNWFGNRNIPKKFSIPHIRIQPILELRLDMVLLMGGVFLIISSQILNQSLPEEIKWKSLPFLVFGLASLMLGAWAIEKNVIPPRISRIVEWFTSRLEIYSAQVVFLIWALAFAIIASLAAGDAPLMRNAPLAVISWLMAILFGLMGAWKTRDKEMPVQALRWAALFFFIAFILRVINTTNIPIILTGDEGAMGLSAVDFLKGRINNIFFTGWYDFPSLFYYLQSLSISLFGQTAAALRIPSALVGGLTVGAIYLLGRIMFGHMTGILAATFLVGFHFHIHFSRLGLNNILDGLSYVVVFGALWYGWDKERRSSFLLAGFALGLSQYFYVSVRGLFGLIPVWLLIAALMDRKRFRRNAGNLLFMAFTAFIVVLPLGLFFNTHREQFLAPLHRFSVLGEWLTREMEFSGLPAWQILLDQLKTSAQAFTSTSLLSWYKPEVPLLRSIPAGVFWIGLTLLILRIRESRTVLIGIWLAAFIFIGGLSTPVPAAQRYVAASPVLALVVGFAVGHLSKLLSIIWKKQSRLFAGIAIGFVALMAADDARFYFSDFTGAQNFSDANGWVAQALADHLQDRDNDWQVAFFGIPRMGYRSILSLPYLAPHTEGFDMNYPWGSPENPELTSNKLIFVFLPENEDNLNAVRKAYPGGQLSEEYFVNGVFLYWLYEIILTES